MSKWQPIETAPKDGTSVLLWFPSRQGYVGRQDCVPCHWSEWGGGVWENATSGHMQSDTPTHWMPLPAPPQPKAPPRPMPLDDCPDCGGSGKCSGDGSFGSCDTCNGRGMVIYA